jgi:outer membrane protein
MKLTVILVFLFIHGVVSAQNSFSLKQAQQYALENSYALKGSEADVKKSEQKIKEILAIGLPQINAQGSFQNSLVLPTTVLPANAFNPMADPDDLIGIKFGTDYNVTGSVTLTQLIFDGSYLVGLEATKGLKRLNELLVIKTEQDVLKEVTKAYYSVLVAAENEKTLRGSLEKIVKIYNETKIIADNGLIESQDADQLKITVSNLTNAVERASRMKEVALEMLKFQMGMKPDEKLELTDVLPLGNDSVLTVTADANADVKKNADHMLLETQIMLNELDMKNQRMGYYPSLGAFFTQQYQALRNDFNFFGNYPWYPATILGVQLSIPIFSSGMRKAKVEQARINVDKSKIQMEQLEHSLQLRLFSLISEFNNALETFNTEKETLALADDIQRKSLVKYKEGVISSLELTMAQNQYLTAQANYINSLYSILNTQAEIDHLLNNFTTK